MTDTTIAALIGAVATVTAAVLTGIFMHLAAKKKTEQAVTDQQKEASEQQEKASEIFEKYGFKAKHTSSRMEILNADGDCKMTTVWRGLTAREVWIPHVPGQAWAATPEGKIADGPRLVQSSTSSGGVYPKAVTLTDRKLDENRRSEYKVRVEGFLTPQDPPLDYTVETVLSKSVLMTKEEADTAYRNEEFKHEYHSFDVTTPTDQLLLEVKFPPAFAVNTFAGVFQAGSDALVNFELNRVRKGFLSSAEGARFQIEHPRVGHRYLIYWSPPPSQA